MTGPTNKAAGGFEKFFGSTLTPDGTLFRLKERAAEFMKLFRNHFWADENLMAVKCCLRVHRAVSTIGPEEQHNRNRTNGRPYTARSPAAAMRIQISIILFLFCPRRLLQNSGLRFRLVRRSMNVL